MGITEGDALENARTIAEAKMRQILGVLEQKPLVEPRSVFMRLFWDRFIHEGAVDADFDAVHGLVFVAERLRGELHPDQFVALLDEVQSEFALYDVRLVVHAIGDAESLSVVFPWLEGKAPNRTVGAPTSISKSANSAKAKTTQP
jgi:hypothetical protein